jgi:Kef-type K+ transport system membrane component KefB/Trk K+ transport system NAD-binding subunit
LHEIALDLLILLAGIWLVAVTLRPIGLPTVMGELIVGVLVGPAVFGLIEPSKAIDLLAEIGIFFLMFHAGVETQPSEFYDAVKRSLGVAVVGAIVPFGVSFAVATAFGLDRVGATFVGLTMTATAVVITLKSLKDLGLANTAFARIIVASCVIDDLLTLVVFSIVLGVLSGGTLEPVAVAIILGKVVLFFGVLVFVGRYVYPRLTLPFRSEGGKGFTFVLLTAFAAGLFAEAIGLHMILGAYLAGLFFEERVAHPNLVRIVHDRAYGIAYSFLGPIFFISLGFSVTFDITGSQIAFLAVLTLVVIVGQILSAGGMALRIGLPFREALTVGVGMCGRAEMAFILAALALSRAAIDQSVFSVLIFTAFVLNLFTPLALKGCAVLLEGTAEPEIDATRGVLQIDKFNEPFLEVFSSHDLPDIEGGVVVYGYGPEVDYLIQELKERSVPTVIVEASEETARRLHERGLRVAHASPSDGDLDFAELAKARAVVANGTDEEDAMLAMGLREQGYQGPIVALIDNPHRRAPIILAGASAAFTPSHILAATLASRASSRIGPRVAGVQGLLSDRLEIVELRIHAKSALAHKSLAESHVHARTGAHIVGQWQNESMGPPPAPDQTIQAGAILIAVGSAESVHKLGDLALPLPTEGQLVVIGFSDVARKVVEILGDVGESVIVVHSEARPGVDIVGDIHDPDTLERASVATARAVILALESDSALLFAVTAVRSFAPETPILAGVDQIKNADRAQRAGADFALSVSQVAGQILIHQTLGETISVQPRIRLIKTRPGRLAEKDLKSARIRERTSCSVVAVERDGDLLTDLPASFQFAADDALYICGSADAIRKYQQKFSATRL